MENQYEDLQSIINISEDKKPKLTFFQRLLQNIGALFVWWFVAYLLWLMSYWWVFTADMMNQFWEVVTSLSWSDMIVDITTWWNLTFKTTKYYSWLNWMILTVYYDQDNLKIDKNSIKSKYKFKLNLEDNTIQAYLDVTWSLDKDQNLLSMNYTWRDAWTVQNKTVFLAEANFKSWDMEDLVVFTNTPPNPKWQDNYRE